MTQSRNIRKRGFTVRVDEITSAAERARRKLHWFVVWNKYIPGVTGRPRQRSQFFATQVQAQEYADKLQELWRTRPPDTHPEPDYAAGTVNDFYKRWKAEYLAREVTAATRRSYAVSFKHIEQDQIGRTHVSAITPAAVILFHQRLLDRGVRLSTRRHVHGCLSAMLFYAKCCGLLAGGDNPCKEMSKKMRKKGEFHAEPEPHPFDAEDADRVLQYFREHEPKSYDYVLFLHDQGPRPGEASALQWPKIDLPRANAHIDRSFSPSLFAEREQSGPWPACGDKETKTYQERDLELTDLVVEMLKRRRIERLRSGRKSEYVFTNNRGGQLRQNGNISRVLTRVLKALDLDGQGYSLYSFRDTFATSHLVEHWDERLAWVSNQLGHKNPETTRRHYYKFKPTKNTRRFANEIRNRGR